MADRASDATARNRYFAIQLVRAGGVAMVVVGMLVTQNVIGWPIEAGYLLLVVGIVDAFLVPQVLARKWRSPPE